MASIELRCLICASGIIVTTIYASIHFFSAFADLVFQEIGLKEALFVNAVLAGVLAIMSQKDSFINNQLITTILTLAQIANLVIIVVAPTIISGWNFIKGDKLPFLFVWYLIFIQLGFSFLHIVFITIFFKKENLIVSFSWSALTHNCYRKRLSFLPPTYSDVVNDESLPPSYGQATHCHTASILLVSDPSTSCTQIEMEDV